MNRSSMLSQLTAVPEWDIVVIGGGATGLGIAIDAAARGFRTLLVEKNDFAKGTSSRSTKLVHGGVRYLAQGNIKLVREALRERGRLLQNAPHVCSAAAFVLPCYRWYDKLFYGIGLKLYDWLAGSLQIGHVRFLKKTTVQQFLPALNDKKLRGGILYYDGQFNDARLAINMAQTAAEQGATVLNYVTATGFLYKENKICGVKLADSFTGTPYTVNSRAVINATGVFADELLHKDDAQTESVITASQGIHIVVEPECFPGTHALMIPKTDDGRVLFAIPWCGKILVGTTDTPVSVISEEPVALEAEIAFLLRHFNRYSKIPVERKDVLSVFAGLRPLVKKKNINSTSRLSRDHHCWLSPNGLVTITGGKWTTWRKMAEDAVNRAIVAAALEAKPCSTTGLHLHGYNTEPGGNLHYYGSDAAPIMALMQEPGMAALLHAKYAYTVAEVVWAARNEMAQTVEDVLARRIRLLFTDARAAMEAAPLVARVLAKELQKDEDWQQQQVEDFATLAKRYLVTG